MIRSQVVSGKGAASPAKLRSRTRTVACAMPVLPPLADVATITCTTTKGIVTCTDESGESVKGGRLKELQSILKPIADAPTLSDAKQAAAKDVSVKAPEAPKPVEAKPVSDTPAPPKEPEAKAKVVTAESNPEAKPAVAEPKADAKPTVASVSSDAKPAEAKPAVVADPKAEMKPAVVADKKPEAPVAKPAVSDASTPEAKLAAEAKPAAEHKGAVITEAKPAPQAPPVAQNVSGDGKPPASTPPKPSAPAEAPKPPAPTQASGSGTPAPQATPSSPDAAGPPANSKPAEAATTNVSSTTTPPPSSTLALQNPSKNPGPVTLATPDLASSRSNEMRPRSVARGNEDSVSFSTGTAAVSSGNASLGLDAPVSAKALTGRFPGNVDPADFLPDDFEGIVTSVTPLKTAAMAGAPKAQTINVMNSKGLIPGNLPPELGDILQLVNTVNTTPVKNLDLRVYPGNVPYDSASGPATVLEFSPGNSAGKGKDVQAVQMELKPGNVTPELSDMLDFFGIGPGAGA